MFNKKRWICALLAMVILLSGCGSGGSGKTKDDDMVTLWMLTEVALISEEGNKTVLYAYEYDENGRMIQKSEHSNSWLHEYAYDAQGNCISWTQKYVNDTMFEPYTLEYSYDYDENGRAIAMYGQEGQLVQEYQYYKNGNLKEVGLDEGYWGWHYLFNEDGYPTELELRNMERNLIDGMEPSVEEVTYTYSLYREEYAYEDGRLTGLRIYENSGPSTEAFEHGELSKEYTFEYDGGNMTQLVLLERADTPYPIECDSHGNVVSMREQFYYSYEQIELPREEAMKLIGKAGLRGEGFKKFNHLNFRIQYRIEQ